MMVLSALKAQWLAWRDPGPAERLILRTARRQWRLVAGNLATSVMEALSEGAALAVVFMAVQVLSTPDHFQWKTNPLVNGIPALTAWMDLVPRVPLFLMLLGLAVLLQLIQSASRYGNALSVGYLAARCRALVTQRIHRQILSFTYPCASSYRVGDLTDLLVIGPEAVRISIEYSSQLLVNGLLIAVYLTVLLALSPWLLLMAILLAVLIMWVQRNLLPRIREAAVRVSADQQQVVTLITEQIQGLRLLHSLGGLDAAEKSVVRRMGDLELSLRRQSQLYELIGPITQALPVMAIAVIGGSSLLFFGDKSSGIMPSLITFVLALQRLNVRFSIIARVFTELSANAGRMGRLDSLLSHSGKQYRPVGGIPYQGLQDSIRLENVNLRYPGADSTTLHSINLTIPRGSTVALVGPSGAGKSSIADLLIGLYAPSQGRVLINGVSLQDLDLPSWQQHLGVVSQDTFLFNTTIAKNIAYGCPTASFEQIKHAAAAAQANSFIVHLPQGYDTVIGERGYRLSGGQRQRLSLARAILRQPDVLVLDEATSALDSQAECEVQQAIEHLGSGITKLVIAHRLSTVQDADLIAVMEQGRIVQKGRHRELISDRAGLYRSLWDFQSGSNASVN